MKTARRVVLAALALALGACSEGYPGKEAQTLRLTYGMNQSETLAAMNHIGRSAHLKTRLRFVLLEGCILEIHARRQFGGKDALFVPLRLSRTTLEKHPEHETYTVSLSATPDSRQEPVLVEAPWTESTQMKWLLEYAKRFC